MVLLGVLLLPHWCGIGVVWLPLWEAFNVATSKAQSGRKVVASYKIVPTGTKRGVGCIYVERRP